MLLPTTDDVIAFWREAGADKWFAKDDVFDAAIKERFLALLEAAQRGDLAGWEDTPDGALALVIVLDQFPRNLFRGLRAPMRRMRKRAASPHARSRAASTAYATASS